MRHFFLGMVQSALGCAALAAPDPVHSGFDCAHGQKTRGAALDRR